MFRFYYVCVRVYANEFICITYIFINLYISAQKSFFTSRFFKANNDERYKNGYFAKTLYCDICVRIDVCIFATV